MISKEFDRDSEQLEFLAEELYRLVGGQKIFVERFPEIISDAVEYVIDPVRTARTKVSELDNVEKTFIGLKVEHFLRDFIGVPKGLRDLRLAGQDVDVKNTVRNNWMIPPETFRNSEPCILVMVATEQRNCSLGIIVAREEYLNKPNRDGKRSIRSSSFENIYWIFKDRPLPESRYEGIDMLRFRQLRTDIQGGSRRAAQFFRENLGKVIHRSVLQGLLYDQKDYMKRIRGNGGARDILLEERTVILSGYFHSSLIDQFKLEFCSRDEFISHNCDSEEWNHIMLSDY
ncbi:NaeI family type II restriction endonuclease [Roseibium sediminis]|uniref:NaeI family type II restriction endonuclease n=1 Tax=Roseibium sediminis TaxID=1775174 RepID=UPI00123DFA4A|nr:NaeI family type II restriction endonuclease [Roseibium sediminis]